MRAGEKKFRDFLVSVGNKAAVLEADLQDNGELPPDIQAILMAIQVMGDAAGSPASMDLFTFLPWLRRP